MKLSHMILDGANGTELQRRGMPPGCCSEQWILDHPEAELDIQRCYVEAGSTALLAPTFGANRASLSRYGLGDRVAEYNRRLVELSREAAGGRALVAGDLSATGLVCGAAEPALFDKLLEVFGEQAEALEAAGVDFYMVETQISLPEAKAAVMAIRQRSDKPVFASFTMAGNGRSFAGGEIASALLTLEKLGISAFGINCVDDAALIERTLRQLRGLTALPLLVQANAGLPETVEGKSVYTMTPETMAADARRYYEAGADIFGSCCGSRAEHIRAIAEAVGALPFRSHSAPAGRYACSEYRFVSTEGARCERLEAKENWEEALEEMEQRGTELCELHLENEEQLERLLNAQDSFRLPLRVRCANEDIQRRLERYYTGTVQYF